MTTGKPVNPYRRPDKRKMFDAVVRCYINGALHFNGVERRGSSPRVAFWDGYHGLPANAGQDTSGDSFEAIYRRAGIEIAKAEGKS